MLLFETLPDYRRAGLDLPKPRRDELERHWPKDRPPALKTICPGPHKTRSVW